MRKAIDQPPQQTVTPAWRLLVGSRRRGDSGASSSTTTRGLRIGSRWPSAPLPTRTLQTSFIPSPRRSSRSSRLVVWFAVIGEIAVFCLLVWFSKRNILTVLCQISLEWIHFEFLMWKNLKCVGISLYCDSMINHCLFYFTMFFLVS